MNKKITIQLIIELPEGTEVEVITKAPIQSKVFEPKIESPFGNEKITLNVNEVAELLGVSVSLVYTMSRKNEIPHKKVGARILFHRPTIEQWLVSNVEGDEGHEI